MMVRMRNSLISIALVLVLAPAGLYAEEGLWLFNQAPKAAIKAKYGFNLTDSLLDKMRLASVRFNNGGSGSFVSSQGLLMTNHHVGSECIYQLGSKEHNYIAGGFVAPARGPKRMGQAEPGTQVRPGFRD